MFHCVLRTELSEVCLYGLYPELDTLLLYYILSILVVVVCTYIIYVAI